MDLKPSIRVVSATPLSHQQAVKMVHKFHAAHSVDPITLTAAATEKGWRVSDDTMEKLSIILEELKKVSGDSVNGDDSVVDKAEKKKNKKRRRESVETPNEKESIAVKQEASKQESTPSQQKKKKHKKQDK